MSQRLLCALAVLALVAFPALLGGCEAEPRCREACEHVCTICESDCTETQIQTCTQSCRDLKTDPDRAQCILDTDLCEDLWEC